MPFGEEITPDGTHRTPNLKYNFGDNVRQKFTGYQKDEETQLDFAEARMYQNLHARFTAVDPLIASGKSANPQTFNRYVYVMNNPLAYTDPEGLQAATPKVPRGRWFQPDTPDGIRQPIFAISAPDGYEPITTRNNNGYLVYTPNDARLAIGMPDLPEFQIRLNEMGPMQAVPAIDLRTGRTVPPGPLTDFDRNGYEVIRGPGYRLLNPQPAIATDVSLETALTFQGAFCLTRAGVATVASRSFATAEGEAIISSGLGHTGRKWVGEFAADSGRKTIEMTPGGKVLDRITNFPIAGRTINKNFPALSNEIWGPASRIYARQTTGEVLSITKGPLRPNAVYHQEFAEIGNNPAAYIRSMRIPSCISRTAP